MQGHVILGDAYFDLTNGPAAERHMRRALDIFGTLSFASRTSAWYGRSDYQKGIYSAYARLAYILSGHDNGRLTMDSIDTRLLALARPDSATRARELKGYPVVTRS